MLALQKVMVVLAVVAVGLLASMVEVLA